MNLSAAFRAATLASALLIVAGVPAYAQDASSSAGSSTSASPTDQAPAGDRVIAVVNGQPITEMDLGAAEPDLQDALSRFPQEEQFPALVKGVIDMRLIARAAEAAGMDKDKETASLLAYAHDRTLRTAYLQSKIAAAVTDQTIKARYDAEMAKFVPGDQVHAQHILVGTEDEAKAIIAELDKGGDFAAIAKEKSLDKASGAQGGDLGFFSQGEMVKPFADAAFALPVGTYTKTPVQSDFGWHVIKVLEKRKEPTPTLDERKDTISRDLARETILAEIDRLRAAAKIEIVAPEAKSPSANTTPPASAPAQ